MKIQAFLDIDIGDYTKYAEEVSSYNRTTKFYTEIYRNYGWEEKSVENCTEEEKELVEIEFTSRKLDGSLRFAKPVDIRAGRVVLELFDDCPKTTANFKALCTGEKGKSKFKKEKDLHYKGCHFHRIVSGFIAQGGDVTMGDGSGGESIYGAKFNDERAGLERKFVKGIVGMAHVGKNSNTSQFFFSLSDEVSKLTGKHVAFGKVIAGMEILDRMSEVGTKEGSVTTSVVIADCGLL